MLKAAQIGSVSSNTTFALSTTSTRAREWGRLALHFVRNPLALAGLVLVGLVVFVTIFGPLIAPYDPNAVELRQKLIPPNSQHWLGTDEVGRDLFSRIIHGARISVVTGTVILLVTSIIGTTVGAIAGYFGGKLDEVLMRTADFFMAFPYLILAMAIAFALGASMQNAVLAIIVVFWPSYARLIRGQVISIRHREFVEAAVLVGAPTARVLLKHVLPQTSSSLVIKFSLDMGFAIVAMASLGFIGLGAQPPTPEWGTMIANSRLFTLTAWWYGLFPGLAIALTAIGFNLLGDTVQELIEPTLKNL